MIRSHNPRITLWAESNVGGGHMQVTSQLARELGKQGADVDFFTSSMHIGNQYDFGDQTNIIELEQILGTSEERPGISTAYGEFKIPGYVNLREYLLHLKKVAASQNDRELPDLEKNPRPWDKLLEAHPLGSWQKEVRRYLATRQEKLRTYLNQKVPDAIVTEFWPMGRTSSDCELVPFCEYVKASPHDTKIYSLERDILLTGAHKISDSRVSNTRNYINEILVRGDDRVFTMNETFPGMDEIDNPIFYAGYFINPLPKRRAMPEENREVLISTGGGFRNRDLDHFKAVIKAKPHTKLKDRTWRLLVTPNCPQEYFDELLQLGANDHKIIVERNKPSAEFKQMLADAALSISQGGYNTTVEVASGETPAIIIPVGDDDEQPYRAERFEKMGFLKSLSLQEAQNPRAFAAEIDKQYIKQKEKKSTMQDIKVDGAKTSAEYIMSKIALARSMK